MRFPAPVLLLALVALPARADVVEDIARLHVEALGGRVQLEALRSLRATGYVRALGRETRIEFVAQRPNRVRTTSRGDGQTLVQASDGVAPPWRLEPEKSSLARRLEGVAAGEFAADAEFDDPLVDAAARGYVLDYAGETADAGHRLLKLLVTHRDRGPCELHVDAETYFITRRITRKKLPSGRETMIETRYEDYRAVAGVLLPFRLAVSAEGRVVMETVLELVVPNARVDASAFAMPAPPVPARS